MVTHGANSIGPASPIEPVSPYQMQSNGVEWCSGITTSSRSGGIV